MKRNNLFAAPLLFATLLFAPKWEPVTADSQVKFDIKGPFGTVHGKFSGLKADIKFSSDDLKGSSVDASIESNTVSTGIALRNKDLRNKEQWLNSDKYPLISFHSKKIEKNNKGYLAVGELKIKDKTRPVTIPFTFSNKGNAGVFKGTFSINREDFDVGKKGGSVGKTVTIYLNIPVKK